MTYLDSGSQPQLTELSILSNYLSDEDAENEFEGIRIRLEWMLSQSRATLLHGITPAGQSCKSESHTVTNLGTAYPACWSAEQYNCIL